MARSITFDGVAGHVHDGRVGAGATIRAETLQQDEIECQFDACAARLGNLGVSLARFREAVEDALEHRPGISLQRLLLDDLYLALACLGGNGRAWRVFDQSYRGYLLRLGTRYVGGRSEAEDLLTDLYHDLVSRPNGPGKLSHYRGYAALGTWLAVIVRRMSFDRGRSQQRRQKRRRALQVERGTVEAIQTPESLVLDAESEQLGVALFRGGMQTLKGPQLLVLSLLYRDGLTLREAGTVMGVDFSTVSRRAKAARASLAKALVRVGQEEFGLSEEGVRAVCLGTIPGASFPELGEEKET